LWQRHKAERGVWSEKMLMALETGVKGNVWFSLIDKVYAERTLGLAWEKVASNAGACGVDGITVERFGKDSQSRLLAVKEHLKRGTYQPKPVKRVMIPKLGSAEKRPLGIPTVTDRVVQTAARMVVEPIFEREFGGYSYGFAAPAAVQSALRGFAEKALARHAFDPDAVAKMRSGAWTNCCKADSCMWWTWTSKATSTASRTSASWHWCGSASPTGGCSR